MKENIMKKSMMSITVAAALLSMSAAHASAFKGTYVGADLGTNYSRGLTTTTPHKMYPGVQAGYNWDMGSNVLLGVEGFADGHTKGATNADAGVDGKLGYTINNFMPYVRVGAVGTSPGVRAHGGLGLEYKFAPSWSALAETTIDHKTVNGRDNRNNNFVLGVNYYFDKPVVAAAAVAAVAAVVAKPVVVAPAPVVVAPVVVAPAPKTIFSDKPITLKGSSFAAGSAKLNQTAADSLASVVDFAAQNKDAKITVVGYTDSTGKAAANAALSAKRAAAVKAYLVSKGVDASRLSTEGKGAANPVGDNKTKAGREANRRVEIDSAVRVAK
jgi:outer membrane protein OmpA-like peptidoglycan-associated protein